MPQSYKRITLKNGLWYDQVLGINDSIKKKIFYDITKYQDETGDAKGAYSVIAQRYEIPEEAARSIAVEGALKLWPMP